MSTAPYSPQQEHHQETDDCDHPDCSHKYAIRDGVAGHCSQDCADRHRGHRGHRFLNTLRYDHRYCATCFARLKDVHTPSGDWRDRKRDPVETALDQSAEFVDAGDGTLELDATACEYETTIGPRAVSGSQSFTSAGTIGEVHKETQEGMPGRSTSQHSPAFALSLAAVDPRETHHHQKWTVSDCTRVHQPRSRLRTKRCVPRVAYADSRPGRGN